MPLNAGVYIIRVTGEADDDVQLEVYDAIGQELGTINNGGDGVSEATRFTVEGPGVSFAVVRNIGNTTGEYTFSITREP